MIESPEESDHTDRKWMREVARSHGIDELGCAYQTAYEKLRELEDAGEIRQSQDRQRPAVVDHSRGDGRSGP